MSGIYFDFSLKKYDFSRKRRPTLAFFHVITPKRRHTSGAVSIRPKYALCTLDGGGAEGARVHFRQKRAHFWALALAFVVQVPTSLSTPLEGARAHGRRVVRNGGGRLAFNAFLALTKWPFSTKMIFSKRSKIHDIKY